MNIQLEQAEKQIGSLTNQLEIGNMNTRKLEHQIESLERELSEKNEEVCYKMFCFNFHTRRKTLKVYFYEFIKIDRVHDSTRSFKETNLELEKINHDKESMVCFILFINAFDLFQFQRFNFNFSLKDL